MTCKCGHIRTVHAFEGVGECYIAKHIKGGHYACICKKYEELTGLGI